jgi:uncharacterized RDD family membrane protein YckC
MDAAYPVEPSYASAFGEPPPLSTFKNFNARANAYGIDFLIVLGLILLIGFGGVALFSRFAGAFGYELVATPQTSLDRLTDRGVSVLLFFVYYAIFEAIFGATPGKLILHMRVVMTDGRPVTLWAAIVRGVVRIVPDAILSGVPAWLSMRKSPQQQRLGDRWARTVVVDSRDPGIRSPWVVGRFASAALAALVVSVPVLWPLLDVELLPVPPAVVAEDVNLTLADVTAVLGDGYEVGVDNRTEDLGYAEATSASFRAFARSDTGGALALVLVADGRLGDDEEGLRTVLDEYIDAAVGADAVATKEPARAVALGDLGVAQEFGIENEVTSGTALIYRSGRTLIRLMVYDHSGAETGASAVALGGRIEERLGAAQR